MISVIIPTLNEERHIGRCIEALRAAIGDCEIIVCDGGSSDMTRDIAIGFRGVTVIGSEKSRGVQMNRGATHAKGDVLLFLHADTVLEEGWAEEIENALTDGSVIGGAFTFSIGNPAMKYRLVEVWVKMRCRVFRLPYGDQGMFIRRDSFIKLGGYRNIPLMEDVDIINRMKNLGKIAILNRKAATSGRRWAKKGIIRTAAINQITMLCYLIGVSPERLAKFYYR
jgi:rSAM/selenodomain-associated transferase 2